MEDARAQTIDFGALGREQVRFAARDHALRLCLAGEIRHDLDLKPYG